MSYKYEKILSLFCHDFCEGSYFFKEYISFALAHNAGSAEEKAKVVRGLYRRLLAVPHVDLDNSLAEYKEWEQDGQELVGTEVVYKKTYAQLTVMMDIDDSLTKVLDSIATRPAIAYITSLA